MQNGFCSRLEPWAVPRKGKKCGLLAWFLFSSLLKWVLFYQSELQQTSLVLLIFWKESIHKHKTGLIWWQIRKMGIVWVLWNQMMMFRYSLFLRFRGEPEPGVWVKGRSVSCGGWLLTSRQSSIVISLQYKRETELINTNCVAQSVALYGAGPGLATSMPRQEYSTREEGGREENSDCREIWTLGK